MVTAAAQKATSASSIMTRRRAAFMRGGRGSELKVNKWRRVGHLEQADSGKRGESGGVEAIAAPVPTHDRLAVGAEEHHQQPGQALPQLGRTDAASGRPEAVESGHSVIYRDGPADRMRPEQHPRQRHENESESPR